MTYVVARNALVFRDEAISKLMYEIASGEVHRPRNDRMEINMEVKGKVVIVTGASSGIGEATAREFGKEGA